MSKESVKKEDIKRISFLKLFKLASQKDIMLIIFGTIAAVINGVMQPLFGQLFGEMTSILSPEYTKEQIFDEFCKIAGYFILVGILSFIFSCAMLYCWINAGEQQGIKIRLAYYESLINQDIGYFDGINVNELSSKIGSDSFKIQQAIGEKLCMNIYTVSMLIGSLIISFCRGWQIALISCVIIPIVWYSCAFLTWVSNGVSSKTSASYQSAGGNAEQALNSIRTVKSLNAESYEANQYHNLIHYAYKISKKYSIFTGVAFGVQNMMLFFDFSLTFWVGSLFIEDEVMNDNMGRKYQYSDIIVVFLAIFLTSFRFGGATDSLKYFQSATIAGYDIFQIIDRVPQISQKKNGLKAEEKLTQGEIKFENVKFSYPNRKDHPILTDLSLTIQPRKKTAIVGKSGCGKSTIIQLLERFYDPLQGRILIDNIDIKDIEINSLRQQIGYVSQEPILFCTTIRENLRYAKPDASEIEMIEALKQANIWEFINAQPQKLDTFVGQNGAQLSGGQKQRICIARAILKKPLILLFDEATSALDTKNEQEVQSTLDIICKNITTIVVAHRLSTIQTSDHIVVLDNQGIILETGTHQSLLELNNHYSAFVKNQHQIEQDKNKKNNQAKSDDSKNNSDDDDKNDSEQKCLENGNEQNINNQKQQEQTDKIIKPLTLIKQTSENENLFTMISMPTINQLNVLDHQLSKIQSMKYQTSQHLQTEHLITDFQTQTLIQDNQINSNKQIQLTLPDSFSKQQQNQQQSATQNNNTNKNEQKQSNEQPKQKYTFSQSVVKLLSYDRKQIINLILGCLFSIVNGVAFPFNGWVFGNISSILLDPNVKNFRQECDKYSLYFALIGIVDLICLILQYYFQANIAEKLTFTLRYDLLKKYLAMPISWFDKITNHSAALSQTLSFDCSQINLLVSSTITFNVSNISSLLSAILLGLTSDWRTSLVGLFLMPLIVLSNILFAVRMNIFSGKMNQSSEDTSKLISESSQNIRTLASLGNPSLYVDNFRNILHKNIPQINKSAFLAGLAIGFTNLSLFGVYAVVFIAGASFHRDYDVEIRDMLISVLCLMFAALGIGKNTEFMGDAGSSLVSANKILNILESKDEIQENEEQYKSNKTQVNKLEGEIRFENVSFKYESRDEYVLKNVSFIIPAHSKVAFVGSSGSGKSSILSLIQRFYTNYTGNIYVDGVDIKSYDLHSYRNLFGVVSQEPVLFHGTIKNNIIYNTNNVTQDQLINAAQQANALTFINQFQEGFEKEVGVRGSQISGGQKQRIAISRMILKQPQIILLDEATSALDSQNEQIIQQSLNEQIIGKTSITVAHRISTIIESDIIFVLNNGSIVEQGNYTQLINNKSHFYKLSSHSNNSES